MNALLVYADWPDERNTSYYRVMIPGKYLARAGHTIEITHFSQIDYSAVPETVLFERVVTPEAIDLLRLAGAKRIIATFDDHYGLIPPSTGSYAYWKGPGKGLELFREGLGLVDRVITPSRLLCQEFSPAARGRMEVVPNFYDPELWSADDTIEISSKIVLGWGGTDGHIETWKQSKLPEVLLSLCRKYGDRIEVRVYGRKGDAFLESSGVPHVSRPWVPFASWPKQVRGFHIGLLPIGGRYDLMRSNLKAQEYGLARIPFVTDFMAPNQDPYLGALGGLRARAKSEWYLHLERLIEEEDLRHHLGRVGYEWATQFNMAENVGVYERVLWG